MAPKSSSFPGLVTYPTNRDIWAKSSVNWLEGRRQDDGAEGLWRIEENLYDFSTFIDAHPGGPDWLQLTKGTDITEAFIVHHLTSLPKAMLEKYKVRPATTKRNALYTFHPDGFYHTLRAKVLQEYPASRLKGPTLQSKLVSDVLAGTSVALALLSAYERSISVAISAGFFLAMTVCKCGAQLRAHAQPLAALLREPEHVVVEALPHLPHAEPPPVPEQRARPGGVAAGTVAAVAAAPRQEPAAAIRLMGHQPNRLRSHVPLRVRTPCAVARPRPPQRPPPLDAAPRHGARQPRRHTPLANHHLVGEFLLLADEHQRGPPPPGGGARRGRGARRPRLGPGAARLRDGPRRLERRVGVRGRPHQQLGVGVALRDGVVQLRPPHAAPHVPHRRPLPPAPPLPSVRANARPLPVALQGRVGRRPRRRPVPAARQERAQPHAPRAQTQQD